MKEAYVEFFIVTGGFVLRQPRPLVTEHLMNCLIDAFLSCSY